MYHHPSEFLEFIINVNGDETSDIFEDDFDTRNSDFD